MNAREGALKILYDIEKNKAYSNISLNKELKNNKYTQIDKNFITELVYGTLENLIYINHIIQQFSKMKIKNINPWILNIIRLGVYQIIFLDKVPNFAIVNESVNLSKKYNKKASGFVNGVLRNIIRNKDKLEIKTMDNEHKKYLSIKYSHPQWMVERFLKYFSMDFTEELLKANNKRPKFYIRVNRLKTDVKEVMEILNKANIEVKESPFIPEALIINSGFTQLEKLEIFEKGYIYIQDLSSMLVSRILDPQEGNFVIDICSAPGGKSTYMAELMNNKGQILSRDIHEHKLKLIKQNAKRLGINIINVEHFDATKLDHNLLGKADKVLVDAPCSGLGVIRRKPEIKYRKDENDIKDITQIQRRILQNASQYVKSNGELVYSTCTIIPDENEYIVEDFLKNNSKFKLIDINSKYSKIIPGEHGGKMVQLYPHIHDVDGFFIAKLMKE
ncbi:MAG: 16S rRNA (cytosine(967)-C(5))-methyltransferase RsmB [Clostridiales bacterium]|nr:16S rRNA (cytosine(967)-C(5))-methyltransferase RsmB [Clostridiales bacterium]